MLKLLIQIALERFIKQVSVENVLLSYKGTSKFISVIIIIILLMPKLVAA